MEKKRIFILSGPAGVGKTTWVKKQIAKYGGHHISRDEIRFELLDKYGGDYFSHEDEVISTFYNNINELLDNNEQNMDIYVDATHLTRAARLNVLRKICPNNAYMIAVWFDVPLELCLARNDKREGRARVPRQTIEDMFRRYSKPSKYDFDEVWRVDAEGEVTK